jgi:hypothetical protein
MASLRDINEYLFYEFGLDLADDARRVSDDWPFSLESVGSFASPRGEHRAYRFTHAGEAYYALDGPYLDFRPAGG